MKFDVIIIGGGLAGMTAGVGLLRAGRSVAAVSEGLSMHETPAAEFIALGGTFLPGDSVLRGEWDGDRLLRVFTRNLEDTPLAADAFILSTGKFFSRGLVATMDSVAEPVFGCDVFWEKDRDKWCDPDFFAPQPFERFGVLTSPDGRVFRGGREAENLYAAGEILAGEVDIVKTANDVCRNLI